MVYAGNSFSLQMLENSTNLVRISQCEAPVSHDGICSIFGHSDIAALAGFPVCRKAVTLRKGDILYVLQLVSGRLAEGTTTLPKNCELKWKKVEVIE